MLEQPSSKYEGDLSHRKAAVGPIRTSFAIGWTDRQPTVLVVPLALIFSRHETSIAARGTGDRSLPGELSRNRPSPACKASPSAFPPPWGVVIAPIIMAIEVRGEVVGVDTARAELRRSSAHPVRSEAWPFPSARISITLLRRGGFFPRGRRGRARGFTRDSGTRMGCPFQAPDPQSSVVGAAALAPS